MRRLTIVFISCLVGIVFINAQNIETIKTVPKPGFSGGINASTQFYNVEGIDSRRSPFSYVLAGNLRFKWGLINVPLSFSFRNQSLSYGASFNKFGISPYYKWARLHLGHRSMSFNKYTLTGKNFFGVGVELKPRKFKLSAFRGKIRNHLAQRDTVIFGANLIPTYQRMATGVKVGYGSRSNYFDLIYLKVKDTGEPPLNPELAEIQLDPVENLVLGTQFRLRILKKLSIRGSVNASMFTENTELSPLTAEEGLAKTFGGLTTVNPSTQTSAAGELGLAFSTNGFNAGLVVKRIEPNYRSLGTPFLQADIQSYTATTSFGLFKRKVNISAQGGIERNNLRNLDYLTRHRVIGAVTASATPIEGMSMSLNYSNFQFETRDGLVQINDTLRYIGVNKSLGGSINYTTKTEGFNYGGFLFLNRMIVEDLSPVQRIGQDITTFTSNIGINLEWKHLFLKVKPSVIYNAFTLPKGEQKSYGFATRISKSFFDNRLTTGLNTRFTLNDRLDKRDGSVWANTLNIGYKITDNSSVKTSMGLMSRKSQVRKDYREFRATVGAGVRF